MTDKEKELTDAFRQLSFETQENIVAIVRFSRMAEGAIRRQYGLLSGSIPAQVQQAQTGEPA